MILQRTGATARPDEPELAVTGLRTPSSGPISQASQIHLSTTGQPYTLVQGQVQAGGNRPNAGALHGSDVQATVADGAFVAWWPGGSHATAARVTSGSRMQTKQLTFTPVGFSKAPSRTTSTSTRPAS